MNFRHLYELSDVRGHCVALAHLRTQVSNPTMKLWSNGMQSKEKPAVRSSPFRMFATNNTGAPAEIHPQTELWALSHLTWCQLFPEGPIASSNRCHASSNRCLTSSNKKLVVTGATLVRLPQTRRAPWGGSFFSEWRDRDTWMSVN